jgi:hypothetical protein
VNTDSCDMVRQPNVEAVMNGPIGSFCIRNWTDNDHAYDRGWKHIWLKLPDGAVSALYLNDSPREPRWQWDGNEDKPTLTPSVHRIEGWHGYVRAGRMVNC